ncbi:Uncharacterised protein (plasmid) [Legionella adelaidensis]|uniref:Uncharacterized protein n=1 Tax=Legionella adelaidensis TaxID=45056 RepID=A0A0W0R4H9_9GAMM|nr:DUF6600 domain-containing protein [Legionella adelaidensis]KTC65968.1 hypothetical protein Lade_0626 [Legionella adelaidensis]VEH86292.1 Uncharacterised protein [Legionella adelaidensis]
MKRVAWLVGFLFLLSFSVQADPPYRVARLSYASGSTSFVPAGEKKWIKTVTNRPLVTGDMLWSGANSKIELQLGSASARLWNHSGIRVLNLNNKVTQFKLTGGTLVLNIQRINKGQYYEVDTPNLAFVTRTPGYYRIFLDVKNKTTTVRARVGEATIYGVKTSFKLKSGKACTFSGNTLIAKCGIYGPLDSFDNWSIGRDRKVVKAVTTKYVSTEVIGYQDLDTYGQWTVDKVYGNVWVPRGVGREWAPYRSGRWVWISRWGWTWVDNQPWGFAPFHYGRWAYVRTRWVWVPGPIAYQPVYAPALVVFVGGRNQLVVGQTRGVAWFPLAPGEVYVPPYPVSRNYFQSINISNTNISQTFINNVYNNNQQTTVVYQNATVAPAITAVPTTAFVQSQPVEKAAIKVTPQTIANSPKESTAAIVPEVTSVLGGETPTKTAPPTEMLNQEAIAVTPPQPTVPFADEKNALEKNPGVPLSEQQAEKIVEEKSKETAEPVVEVITPPASEPLLPAEETEPATLPTTPVDAQQPPAAAPEKQPEAVQPEAVQPQMDAPQSVDQLTEQPSATESAPTDQVEPAIPESTTPETPAVEPAPMPEAPPADATPTPTPEVPAQVAPEQEAPIQETPPEEESPSESPATEVPPSESPAIETPVHESPSPEQPSTDEVMPEAPPASGATPPEVSPEAPAEPEVAPSIQSSQEPEVIPAQQMPSTPEPSPQVDPEPVAPIPAPSVPPEVSAPAQPSVPAASPPPEAPAPEPVPVPAAPPVPQSAPAAVTPEPVPVPTQPQSVPGGSQADEDKEKN